FLRRESAYEEVGAAEVGRPHHPRGMIDAGAKGGQDALGLNRAPLLGFDLHHVEGGSARRPLLFHVEHPTSVDTPFAAGQNGDPKRAEASRAGDAKGGVDDFELIFARPLGLAELLLVLGEGSRDFLLDLARQVFVTNAADEVALVFLDLSARVEE